MSVMIAILAALKGAPALVGVISALLQMLKQASLDAARAQIDDEIDRETQAKP